MLLCSSSSAMSSCLFCDLVTFSFLTFVVLDSSVLSGEMCCCTGLRSWKLNLKNTFSRFNSYSKIFSKCYSEKSFHCIVAYLFCHIDKCMLHDWIFAVAYLENVYNEINLCNCNCLMQLYILRNFIRNVIVFLYPN